MEERLWQQHRQMCLWNQLDLELHLQHRDQQQQLQQQLWHLCRLMHRVHPPPLQHHHHQKKDVQVHSSLLWQSASLKCQFHPSVPPRLDWQIRVKPVRHRHRHLKRKSCLELNHVACISDDVPTGGDADAHQISVMADVHRGAEPSSQEGMSMFQVRQVLLEHHLNYKRHGLIQDNCFLSDDDDDDVLALPLSANPDEEIQEDETDMFKKLIAEREKGSSSPKKLKSPPARKVKSPPTRKVKSPAKKVKEHVGCSHIDVDVGVSDSVPAMELNQMWSLRLKKVRQLRKGGMS